MITIINAGVSRQPVHYDRKRNPLFADAYNLAREEIHEFLCSRRF